MWLVDLQIAFTMVCMNNDHQIGNVNTLFQVYGMVAETLARNRKKETGTEYYAVKFVESI